MKLKLTNREIIQIYQALTELSQNKELRFSGKTVYALAYNLRKFQDAAKVIEDARNKIISRYADNTGQVPPEKLSEATKDLNDLLDTFTELNLRLIFISDLNLDENKIPFSILSVLLNSIILDNEESEIEQSEELKIEESEKEKS